MTEEEIRRIASEPQTSHQEAGEALDAALALVDKLHKLRRKPERCKSLDDMLDYVEVNGPGLYGRGALNDWWAVSTGDDGILAYFLYEADAFRFRLDLINHWLNG